MWKKSGGQPGGSDGGGRFEFQAGRRLLTVRAVFSQEFSAVACIAQKLRDPQTNFDFVQIIFIFQQLDYL